MSEIDIAMRIAVRAYSGKTDKAGQPYILHPLRLMMQFEDVISMIAALLHDVIEDTDITEDDLREEGIPEDAVVAIVALSRLEDESYEDFIERVCRNAIARKVKRLDIKDNMDLGRLSVITEADLRRTAKYHRALRRIELAESAR